jgi:exodeoxyribonuclease VII small subunit
MPHFVFKTQVFLDIMKTIIFDWRRLWLKRVKSSALMRQFRGWRQLCGSWKEGLSLEKALELFAEGIELSRVCSRNLEAAEQRIAILTRDDAGSLSIKEVDSLPAAGEGNSCGLSRGT